MGGISSHRTRVTKGCEQPYVLKPNLSLLQELVPTLFLNIKSEIWCLVYIYSLSLFRLTSCLELGSYVCLVPALLGPWNRTWQLWWFLRDCHTSYMVTNLPRANCLVTSSSKLIYTSSLRWCQRIGSHSYLNYTLNNRTGCLSSSLSISYYKEEIFKQNLLRLVFYEIELKLESEFMG